MSWKSCHSSSYIETFCYIIQPLCPVNEENDECPKVLRTLEKIDDEAAEYGIQMVKMNDRLMAKKYGFRNPPGLVYFRKGKHIKYDGRYQHYEASCQQNVKVTCFHFLFYSSYLVDIMSIVWLCIEKALLLKSQCLCNF